MDRQQLIPLLISLGYEDTLAQEAATKASHATVDSALQYIESKASELLSNPASVAPELKDEQYKMVLCVRQDLGMRAGKVAAQCAHAALMQYQLLTAKPDPKVASTLEMWFIQGQAKVVVKAKDLDELMATQQAAEKLGIPTCIVQDQGRTQVAPGSQTVMAVGPGPVSLIDQVTGGLKLL